MSIENQQPTPPEQIPDKDSAAEDTLAGLPDHGETPGWDAGTDREKLMDVTPPTLPMSHEDPPMNIEVIEGSSRKVSSPAPQPHATYLKPRTVTSTHPETTSQYNARR